MQGKTPGKNLYLSHPPIAKEWHPTKNGGLVPRDITTIANRKVWWLCSKDHVWSATINERIHGNNCPYCAGEKVEEENPAQGPGQLPSPQAGESAASKTGISTRRDKEEHSKNKVSSENCLQTVNPSLAKEWHPRKNAGLTPKDVTAFSHEQVWWLCPKGHEWKAPVLSRNKGQGCFYCSYIRKRHS